MNNGESFQCFNVGAVNRCYQLSLVPPFQLGAPRQLPGLTYLLQRPGNVSF